MRAANDNHLFYTYVWRDAAGTPFYVGKGKGSRAHNTKMRSKEFKEIHAQGGCTVKIVDWFIHEAQAHAHEIELIAFYGRREMGGILVNKTDGGDGASGCRPSAETRAKIGRASLGNTFRRGIPHTEEIKAKLSASLAGRPKSAETRVRMSIASLGNTRCVGRVLSDETRAKMSAAGRIAPPKAGFKGVSARRGKWVTQVVIDGKQRYLGTFPTAEEAARAYDDAVDRFWGPGPWYRNFPSSTSASA